MHIIISVISAIDVYWFPFSKFRSDLLEELITDKIVLSLDICIYVYVCIYIYENNKHECIYVFGS
jgi:hypothetical protein